MGTVIDVLTSLSLEEKVAQLACVGRCYEMPELSDAGNDVDLVISRFPNGIGQLGRPRLGRTRSESLALTTAIQTVVRAQTHAGIGVLFNEEGVHGLMGGEATVFPAALALAATWDPALVETIYSAVAHDCRAGGSNYVYAPVLDLGRDPRWGRVEETFGEDPYLVARMGVAAVVGLQGTGYRIAPDRVLACAKHFLGHGQPQAGSNAGPVGVGERELRRDHLLPFAAVIEEADLGAIMVAYHELDGIPMHVNSAWITEVLRKELGFAGVVTSDGFGITQLETLHHVATDPADAARQAFTAGVDCEVPEALASPSLVAEVREGRLSLDVVDQACGRVLRAKDRLGLLGPPEASELPVVDSEAHRALALEAAERAIVLLTNDRNRLPLDAGSMSTILVTGPNAADAHLGGYTDPGADGVSVLAGIESRFVDSRVTFQEGCRITDEPAGATTWWQDDVALADPNDDDDRITSAVAAAANADVAIVVIGGNEATHREGWWFDHLGDRSDLTMPGCQDELVERIAGTGTPTVVVVISAGPVDLRRVVSVADAVLWTCYPGEVGGTALARILAGDVEPAGRLPVTFPRTTGQIPIYSGRQPSAGRGYLHGANTPLFPFGHGLGYTVFGLGAISVFPTDVTSAELETGGCIEVEVDVTNRGDRAGSELIRVVVQDLVASVAQPERLAAFARVHAEPGATTCVRFRLDRNAFEIIDRKMQRTIEPGDFDLRILMSGQERRAMVRVGR